MKCDICGRMFECFDKYYELSIGKYYYVEKEALRKKWEKLSDKIKSIYGSFEKYWQSHLDESLESIIDIRTIRICEKCFENIEELGYSLAKIIREKALGED